ncbi:MAG: hypothetical protein QOG01_4787 [Pseudonocardiales bacterium]|jgi:hypothetical protein|nr:hypothetical protein [Pseudonocardiales bacterium]
MSSMGGAAGGFPASLTISSGPWAGSYDDRRPNANGTVSYYGPTPSGTVQATGGFINKTYAIPTLHITLAADLAPHASLDMGGKNAHLHWNGGSASWDTAALDTDKLTWVNALETSYAGGVYNVLSEVSGQLDSGITPAYAPPAEATGPSSGGYTLNPDDWPALPSTTPAYEPEPPAEEYGTAYIDEVVGDVYNFAVSDGRSLSIERSVLEEAAAGTLVLPESDVWLTVVWADKSVVLPDTLFEVTMDAS